MDDLLALLDEAEESDLASEAETRSNQKSRTRHLRQTEQFALSAEERTGIRMINLHISGRNLMSLMSDHPYHSPSQLCAYSLGNLNRLLAVPSATIGSSSVTGKTELVTVGIVFSNSGSRLSTAGNAFCALTLGNLTTGPAVSLLLFGECYGKRCRSCTPGKVVLIVNPRLIPPKSNGNDRTSITFSVSDASDLRTVADARDFGICKALTRAKNEVGQWVANGKPCQNYVDKRLGEYCAQHRKQRAAADPPSAASKSTSNLQVVRENATMARNTQGGVCNKENKASLHAQWKANRIANDTSRLYLPVQDQSHNTTIHALPRQIASKVNPSNSLLNPRKIVTENAQEMRQRKQSASTRSLGQASNTHQRSLGSVGSGRVNVMARSQLPLAVHGNTGSSLGLGQRLEAPKPRGITGPKRKRVVNTDFTGFEGSVPVPAPSSLFLCQKNPGLAGGLVSYRKQPSTKCFKSITTVREQQQKLASQLRAGRVTSDPLRTQQPLMGTNNSRVLKTRKQEQNEGLASSSSLGELFGPMDDTFRNQILSTESRFANEAHAEEYARSRRVVSELEEEETKLAKKGVHKEARPIVKEWYCAECNKSFQHKPAVCIRQEHRVKLERTIRDVQSIEEQRVAMTEKKVVDGGLVLGSGLEWSQRRSGH
jgi:Primase zinc finger